MHARALAVLVLALPEAVAHIALWHPSMYGWKEDQPNQSDAHLPLEHLNFNEWWFHGPGFIDHPPVPGVFMDLPAGGTFTGQVSCNKAMTTYGPLRSQLHHYACDNTGAMHTTDTYGSPNPTNVKGCGLAIAYKSNVADIVPEDFTVISANYTCPWTREVDFHIPGDLPECPPEGCTCQWASEAGSQQIYFLGYRCRVTGATHVTPLPPPQIARKCPVDKSNCTIGGKQPHYWLQNERNNNFQGWQDAPFYNGDYGFANGAQTGLFATVGGSQPGTNPAPAPGSSVTSEQSTPSSTPPAPESTSQSLTMTTVERPTTHQAPAPTTTAATGFDGAKFDKGKQCRRRGHKRRQVTKRRAPHF